MNTNERESYFSRKKRKLLRNAVPLINMAIVSYRWWTRKGLKPSKYDGAVPLIVSLTSYPPRFPTLHLTLRSLLMQGLQPTRTILWIATKDADRLPAAVTQLQSEGLEIRYCEDIKSYKKIIPALEAYPGAVIVTADDDIYYWENWLKELVDQSKKYPADVIAHRVHRLRCEHNTILPYREWQENILDQEALAFNFATGIGGVLYPPGCLHLDVMDQQKFMHLCLNADDVWLYWMTRRNGHFVRRSLTKRNPYPWRSSQKVSLWKENRTQNDLYIANMVAAYGLP